MACADNHNSCPTETHPLAMPGWAIRTHAGSGVQASGFELVPLVRPSPIVSGPELTSGMPGSAETQIPSSVIRAFANAGQQACANIIPHPDGQQ